MHNARLGGLVHGRAVGDRSGLGCSGVPRLDGLIQLLAESLQTGFDTFVAGGETRGLAGGFDGRFCIGHDVIGLCSRTETQTGAGESRAILAMRQGAQKKMYAPVR